MGGMSWEQAQWQKAWFEQMEREGRKVVIVDPKNEFENYLTFGKAGRGKAIRCESKKG